MTAALVRALLVALALTPGVVADASHVVYDDSLRGQVTLAPVVAGGAGAPVRVEVRFPDGAPASGLAVRAEVFHGLARRVAVAFVPDGPGGYAGRLPVDGADGLWQGVIRVEGGRRPLVADIAFIARRELEADVAVLRRPMGFRPAGVFTSPPWVDHLVWAGVLGIVLGCALVVSVRRPSMRPPSSVLQLPAWATAIGVAGALAGAVGAYWDVAWHVIVNIFVLEFEFPSLEGWHVLLARPRGLYPLFTTALALLVLGSVARAGGRFAATQAAAAAWLLRAALGVALLPALGRSAPLWPPLYVLPALALDLALAAAPAAWSLRRRYLVSGLAATAVAYLGHNGVAALLPARDVPPAELWAWFPLALLAGAAAALLGLRIGVLARPEAGTPV